jgi:NADPH:quinone reductase-like Zn-dependent oxidoreductase/catechol 2,3-dioxygenase-like lactoylglutathione lyase family enzyme
MNPMDLKLAAGDWKPAPAAFPMVLGADGAGVVERVGEGTTRFSAGDKIFGQLLVAPIGSSGTYAEYVAVSADAPLARVPSGLDDALAAALPTAGGAGLALVESLEPLAGKTVLVVGAGGGVGAFATQFAVNAGARVIANVRAPVAERMRGYGAAETFDHTEAPLVDSVRQAHPDGIDVLIDLVSDADDFAALASLVRPAGAAVSTQYVADADALAAAGVTATNFALQETPELLERVADALIEGKIVAPPIRRVTLDEAPGILIAAGSGHADGKTVIALDVPHPVSSRILGAAHTGFTVVDLERSLGFWRDTLGFEVALRASLSGEPLEQITGVRDGSVDLAILNIPGGHQLELVQYGAPPDRRHIRPRPSDVGSVHLSLFVSDIEAVMRAAAAAGWRAAGTPQTMRDGPAIGATFEYLTDPDGTILELIQPPS